MEITFYLKPTKKGFFATCDLMQMSIYKGLKAWGKTQDESIIRLVNKWNNKVNKGFKMTVKNSNVTATKIQFNLTQP